MKGIKPISVVSKKVKKGYIEREMLSLCSSLCLSRKYLSNLSMRQCIPIIDLSLPFRDLSVWSMHIEIWAKVRGWYVKMERTQEKEDGTPPLVTAKQEH